MATVAGRVHFDSRDVTADSHSPGCRGGAVGDQRSAGSGSAVVRTSLVMWEPTGPATPHVDQLDRFAAATLPRPRAA
jgi:hypothetical protein